jgi:hypothetical protein
MPKRIRDAKEQIDSALNTLEFELQQTAGMATPEFTRLVLEVLDERSTDWIMTRKGAQVVMTGPPRDARESSARACAERLVEKHAMCHGCDDQFYCGIFELWRERWG